MVDTWGIPGPTFLVLYPILIAVPVVIGLGWRVLQTLRGAGPTPELTVYHLAYLAGGRRRVAETAVARLLSVRRLRVSSTGTISTIKGDRATDKVERAVIGAANRAKLGTITGKLGAVVGKLNADLADAGLAVPEARVRHRRGAVALLCLLVTGFGVARLAAGASNHRPVGWLLLELLGSVVVLVLVLRVRRKDTALATVAGRRVLAGAKAAQQDETVSASADRAAMAVVGAGVAGAVVFGGFALYPDQAVQTAMAHVPASGGSFFGGGGDGGSGGSSCGGNSCGGGSSCGGGGGCGG